MNEEALNWKGIYHAFGREDVDYQRRIHDEWLKATSGKGYFCPDDLKEQGKLKIVRELWRRGELRFLLHPSQQIIWDRWYAHSGIGPVYLNLPRQFGKGFFSMTLLAAEGIKNPGSRLNYYAPTGKQGVKVFKQTWYEVIRTAPLDIKYSFSGDMLEFWNGSTIEITGVTKDGGATSRGTKSNLAVLDEARDVKNMKDLLDNIINPMFTTTKGRLLITTTPPDSTLHDAVKFYVPMATRTGGFIHVTWRDNPFIDGTWYGNRLLESEEPLQSNKFRREHCADYTIVEEGRKCIRQFSEEANAEFFENYKESEVIHPYVMVDVGKGTAPTVCLFAWFDPKHQKLIIWEEMEWMEPTISVICQAVAGAEKRLWGDRPEFIQEVEEPNRFCDPDPTFQKNAHREHGMFFENAGKLYGNGQRGHARRLMIEAVNEMFYNDMLVIHPQCKQTIFQMKTAIWNEKQTDYETTGDGTHFDCVDAVKYLCINCDMNPGVPIVSQAAELRYKQQSEQIINSRGLVPLGDFS